MLCIFICIDIDNDVQKNDTALCLRWRWQQYEEGQCLFLFHTSFIPFLSPNMCKRKKGWAMWECRASLILLPLLCMPKEDEEWRIKKGREKWMVTRYLHWHQHRWAPLDIYIGTDINAKFDSDSNSFRILRRMQMSKRAKNELSQHWQKFQSRWMTLKSKSWCRRMAIIRKSATFICLFCSIH